ncbi:MAG: hypothetical protein AB7Q23_08950 [Hyphomonadaceae bacterium]
MNHFKVPSEFKEAVRSEWFAPADMARMQVSAWTCDINILP